MPDCGTFLFFFLLCLAGRESIAGSCLADSGYDGIKRPCRARRNTKNPREFFDNEQHDGNGAVRKIGFIGSTGLAARAAAV
jgi:hypothetical protein